MLSLLVGTAALVAARIVPIQTTDDVFWDLGNQYETLRIHVNDYVEFHTLIPAHNIYLGQKPANVSSGAVTIEQKVAACNYTALESEFTLISHTAASDLCLLPLCSFVSGPVECVDVLPTGCATTVTGNQQYRARHQFTEAGVYYAVCTANHVVATGLSAHCQAGMHVRIEVSGTFSFDPTPRLWHLKYATGAWGSAHYPDVSVHQGDKVRFIFNAHYHDVYTKDVSALPNEIGDCSTDGVAWVPQDSNTSAVRKEYDYQANITGQFLFFCSLGSSRSHCNVDGMHFRLTVLPPSVRSGDHNQNEHHGEKSDNHH